MRLRTLLLLGLPLTLVAAAPFGYDLTSSRTLHSNVSLLPHADPRKAAERLCASRSVNERLKARVFDDAAAVGNGNSANLDLLASFSEVRMDQPLLKSRDQELGVTVCSGRFVLLLPPGSEQRFDGRTLLQADIEYAAQPAADGSGLVYQLRGADSIVYRLAAYNLHADPALAEHETKLAAAPAAPAVTELPKAVEPVVPPLPEAVKSSPPVLAKAPAAPPPPPKPLIKADKPIELAAPALKKAAPEKPQKGIPKEIKLAKVEPRKPVAKADKPKEVKLAKAEPKKAAAAKEVKKVVVAARIEPKSANAVKPNKVELAKATPKPTEKARLVKLVKLALAAPKAAPAKPASVRSKPVALAAVTVKKPPAPRPAASSGTDNSFLAYEQRRAATPQRASADNDCDAVDGAEARLICANPNLAAKKRAATNFYLSALEDADGATRQALNRTRGQFASYLSRCSTASCLAQAYDGRIAEIRDIMRNF